MSLQQTFENFASFGSKANLNQSQVTIDNSKFAKLCRDTKIIGKNVTSVDVDIIFKKALTKGERQLNYHQFENALRLLAGNIPLNLDLKYPDKDDAFLAIEALVLAHSTPTANATQAKTDGIYSKLTDTSQYTGTHKL